jgi:6-phosphofructokinase 2
MDKFNFITLTVNPALDKSAHFKGLVPEQKIRCENPQFDAGGGGINVSKAIAHLGGKSKAIFTSGGATGEMIETLLAKENIEYETIRIQSWTRESFVAIDDNTNLQYRFGFKGAAIRGEEKERILEEVRQLDCDYLVLSGSLNEGLPADFYQQIAQIVKKTNIKIVVDAYGDALKNVLKEGVYLIKPNVGELAKLIGVAHLELEEVHHAAQQIINNGGAELVAVSLGA